MESVHPAAALFPMMTADELQALADDIRENGLREPIETYDGQIIDGRNRLEACKLSGVTPRMREWDGEGSLTAYIVSKNLRRRHLTPSQRAELGRELEPLFAAEAAEQQENAPKNREGKFALVVDKVGKSAERAAKSVGSSERSVKAAKAIHAAAPELSEKIKAGELTVHAAEKQIKEEAAAKPSRPTDELGVVLPDNMIPVFEARKRMKAVLNHLSKLKTLIGEAIALPGSDEIDNARAQQAERDRKNIGNLFRFAMPYALCSPVFIANHAEHDLAKRGWLTEQQYKNLPDGEK